MPVKSILFVCSANICRSPMAEGLFRAMVQDGLEAWGIESAGVYAQPGYQAAENTLAVLRARGIELGEHRSKPITLKLIEEHQLILTMEQGHKEALQTGFPRFTRRIFLLSEMVDESYDIADPIGQEFLEYVDTAREIDSILSRGFERICSLAEAPAITYES